MTAILNYVGFFLQQINYVCAKANMYIGVLFQYSNTLKRSWSDEKLFRYPKTRLVYRISRRSGPLSCIVWTHICKKVSSKLTEGKNKLSITEKIINFKMSKETTAPYSLIHQMKVIVISRWLDGSVRLPFLGTNCTLGNFQVLETSSELIAYLIRETSLVNTNSL